MQTDKAFDILKSALLLERRARAFYGKLAEQTAKPAVREFFTLMTEEEDKHIEVLSAQFRAYRENGEFAGGDKSQQAAPDLSTQVLSDRMKRELAAADFEAAAIAAALSMERRAVQAYSERAAAATDPEEKELYRWLAAWETDHLEFLAKLDRELIDEAWNDSHFWPL